VLVSFQEVYVSGYFPNTSMMAAAFFGVALLLATWPGKWIAIVFSALFFASAVWCRIDVLLMGLTFLGLLFQPNRRSLLVMMLFGFCFLMGVVILYSISNISFQEFLAQSAQPAGSGPDIGRTLTIYSTVFSLVAIYFSIFGLIQLYSQRNWRLTFLSLIAPLPLMLLYGIDLDSPKKVLYDLVLYAIPIIIGLLAAFKRDTRMTSLILLGGLILAEGQYIFTPAYDIMFSRSILVHTSDEARLRGAIAYTPIYFARSRRTTHARDEVYQEKLRQYLEEREISYLISQDWMTNQWVLYFLQGLGYRITETQAYKPLLEDGQKLVLTRNGKTVHLVRWHPTSPLDLPSSLQEEIDQMQQVLYIGPDYTTSDYAQNSFLANEFDWEILPDWGRFETILFSHK
jgi:hypothetical protein